jgi:hypothetical protein
MFKILHKDFNGSGEEFQQCAIVLDTVTGEKITLIYDVDGLQAFDAISAPSGDLYGDDYDGSSEFWKFAKTVF